MISGARSLQGTDGNVNSGRVNVDPSAYFERTVVRNKRSVLAEGGTRQFKTAQL